MHAIVLSIAVIITTLLCTLGYSGLNLFGVCSISTSNKNNYVGIVCVVIFIAIEFYTFYFLRKSIPAI
jgi:hypothetical protein